MEALMLDCTHNLDLGTCLPTPVTTTPLSALHKHDELSTYAVREQKTVSDS
jgi:hypothetical protein